jgi:hypothetical protein
MYMYRLIYCTIKNVLQAPAVAWVSIFLRCGSDSCHILTHARTARHPNTDVRLSFAQHTTANERSYCLSVVCVVDYSIYLLFSGHTSLFHQLGCTYVRTLREMRDMHEWCGNARRLFSGSCNFEEGGCDRIPTTKTDRAAGTESKASGV